MAGHFQEFFFYSPFLDSQAVRLSIFNDRGGEYFTIIPHHVGRDAAGKYYRQRRDEALLILRAALDQNLDPGPISAIEDEP